MANIQSNTLILFAICTILTACGGGSGTSDSGNTGGSGSSIASSSSSSVSSPSGSCPANQKTRLWPGYTKPENSARILVFSKTAGFRHSSIEVGQQMLESIAQANDWTVDITEDATDFRLDNLNHYNTVVWLSTTGDVLNSAQQQAFEEYIEHGGGYLGIHAAADTEYSWPWYGDLVGAYFHSHPQNQTATVHVENAQHPASQHLGDIWQHYDEWYNYRNNPREGVEVVLSLDETSYDPGEGAMGDHPIAWYHTVGLGRAFYTGLGHTEQAYADADFQNHILGALRWAGRLSSSTPDWQGAAPPDTDFSTTVIASGVDLPVVMEISKQGEMYVIGRRGAFYAMRNNQLTQTDTIATNSVHEGGLIGFTLAPDFTQTRHAYFHYTAPDSATQKVSRITIKGDHSLDLSSEVVVLEYPVDFECCHVAGDLAFDSLNNLYIAIGDNTNPFASDGYAPIDERPGRNVFDAQRTSANSADVRGSILRIKPNADGGYTIPDRNLFVADNQHRGEIFSMGLRNPYRTALDSLTDQLFWGDIGPDAGGSNPTRGPGGIDEINKTYQAGNFGWPYLAGNNIAYYDYDFATGQSGALFSAHALRNLSVNNTGSIELPPAQPAWISMSHRALMVGDVYRWSNSIADEYKLPSYFDGRLLFWNFNNDRMYEVHVDDDAGSFRTWLDTSRLAGIIDAKISPQNHRLYLLGYGGNCCDSPANSGMLAEVRYTGSGPETPSPTTPTYTAGDSVTFSIDGKILTALGNNNLALADAPAGNASIFSLESATGNHVYLQSVSTGLYIRLDDAGTLVLDATNTAQAEAFELQQNQDGSYALKSSGLCQYVSLAGSSDLFLSANANTVGNLQIFDLNAAQACTLDESRGIACRTDAPAYLNMPEVPATDFSNLPALLSQTGAFADTATLTPAQSLIPYSVIAPLWSDGAQKDRWFSLPTGTTIGWNENEKWQWPAGTVFVKHFTLPIDESDTSARQRLETRLLVVGAAGSVYGATYKWRDDNSDADLLNDALNETITIAPANGERQQTWTYPGPEDCLACHNIDAQGVLGVKTAALNSTWQYPSGVTDHQLLTLSHLGALDTVLTAADLTSLPAHAAVNDNTASLELRVRSYWDVNCANCHGVQGIASLWDARMTTPLDEQGIVNGALANQRDYLTEYGLANPAVVSPGSPDNSILYIRDKSADVGDRMPPLGRNLPDEDYLHLLETWINQLETP
ncbi:ThuA domain-containing protein [Gilvimarinus sp. SDUM040013]|uniref:ThuA domain-containing protein n=1 Tax=Gilvimarinus gilvus TaxID=3058038 RepID=A0ABU4S2E3_9GAMM|nr:ThuA domain-containing protein [Gilvimarinus sp. SDUM040013]MDO3384904.1 ThuA domain-containing protein [Gilvimarinus sp. SDUM040013]MDX6850671.1 ThuA domain-containing protein [Gilvimarinus sp. SDUM040013]